MNIYLTIDQAAKLLGVKRLTIHRHIKSGRLLAYRIGRLVRITEGDLKDFAERRPTRLA